MAKSAKKVTVVFDTPSEKKHVVRFDSSETDPAIQNVYVSKAALKKLGDPDSITITIEASEDE